MTSFGHLTRRCGRLLERLLTSSKQNNKSGLVPSSVCVWVGICAYMQIAMCLLVCVGYGEGHAWKAPNLMGPSWAPVTQP